MANEENEFSDYIDDEESAPIGTSENTDENVFSNGEQGKEYDFSQAPDTTKAPERENLDGKEVTITNAKLFIPPSNTPWQIPYKGDKKNVYKNCKFEIAYDNNGQKEFYSGVRIFKREDGISHPTIQRKTEGRLTQATNLLKKYCEYKKVNMNDVSLKEFLGFLVSKPKAILKQEEFINPENDKSVMKNMVDKFI